MSTHHGFIKEFPWIRVDAFDGDPALVNPYGSHQAPQFHLLTHSHTDHLVGLNSPDFSGKIYCTAITKQIVLKTMEAGDRVRLTEAPGSIATRKFANLRRKEKNSRVAPMDRMAVIQINVPLLVESSRGNVMITALDANHCPGSCMFLIESVNSTSSPNPAPRAALITGDIRAEKWWVESLSHNSVLAKYIRVGIPDSLVTSSSTKKIDLKGKGKAKVQDGNEGLVVEVVDRWPRLDCIYLDTSAVLVDEELVGKREAIEGVVELIKHFPSDTKFFINAWTWGYEELLKGIALAFNEKIHLDDYKHRMYTSAPLQSVDPLLASLGTQSPQPLRFHACERRWKCDQVWSKGIGSYEFSEENLPTLRGKGKKLKKVGEGEEVGGGKTVFVNPWSMSRKRWEEYKGRVTKALVGEEGFDGVEVLGKRLRGEGESALPDFLIVPLARHSTLPELQHFVSIFRPQTLYPLTISDESKQDMTSTTDFPCKKYRALPSLFADHLGPGGKEQLEAQAIQYTNSKLREFGKKPMPKEVVDDFKMSVNGFGPAELYWSNTEGGKDVAKLVKDWTTSTVLDPPVSPVVAKKKQKVVIPTPNSTSASSALRKAVAPSPTSIHNSSILQPISIAIASSRLKSSSASLRVPKLESTSLLPSPFINPQVISPPIAEENITSPPKRKRAKRTAEPVASSMTSVATTSAVIFRAPITTTTFYERQNVSPRVEGRRSKSVAFAASPTIYSLSPFSSSFNKPQSQYDSPELVGPVASQPISSIPSSIRSPSKLPPLAAQVISQIQPSSGIITTRPTSESKQQRERWERAFSKTLGGIFSQDGSIIPFPKGHARYVEPVGVQGRIQVDDRTVEESQGTFVEVRVTPSRRS